MHSSFSAFFQYNGKRWFSWADQVSLCTLPYIVSSMCAFWIIEDAQGSMYWLIMAGSLWFLLGFWCCGVSARSFLHSSEHSEYICTICLFSGLLLNRQVWSFPYMTNLLSLFLAEYFTFCQWPSGLLWFYVWWWLWWRISYQGMAILCSDWCRYWGGIGSLYFLPLHCSDRRKTAVLSMVGITECIKTI
jgi:hypothetical protein